VISDLPCRLSPTCHRVTWDAIIEGELPQPLRRVPATLSTAVMCGLLALPKVSQALMCAQSCYAHMKIGLCFFPGCTPDARARALQLDVRTRSPTFV